MAEWARPGLLAEPEWLWAHRDDAGVRLIDCGSVTPSWDPHSRRRGMALIEATSPGRCR